MRSRLLSLIAQSALTGSRFLYAAAGLLDNIAGHADAMNVNAAGRCWCCGKPSRQSLCGTCVPSGHPADAAALEDQ